MSAICIPFSSTASCGFGSSTSSVFGLTGALPFSSTPTSDCAWAGSDAGCCACAAPVYSTPQIMRAAPGCTGILMSTPSLARTLNAFCGRRRRASNQHGALLGAQVLLRHTLHVRAGDRFDSFKPGVDQIGSVELDRVGAEQRGARLRAANALKIGESHGVLRLLELPLGDRLIGETLDLRINGGLDILNFLVRAHRGADV